MNLILILADLGRVKAFRLEKDQDDPNASPAFRDLLNEDLENQHSKVSERMADQAGRFPSGPAGMAIGERHSEEEEARQNQLGSIAERINDLANREKGKIYLAAPQTMLQSLLDELHAGVRKRVKKELALNLVKAPKLEMLKRFGVS